MDTPTEPLARAIAARRTADKAAEATAQAQAVADGAAAGAYLAGATYDQLAEALGCSREGARRSVKRGGATPRPPGRRVPAAD